MYEFAGSITENCCIGCLDIAKYLYKFSNRLKSPIGDLSRNGRKLTFVNMKDERPSANMMFYLTN